MADEYKQKLSFDITDFKTSISDMNRGIRIAQNNFKAASGALGDWTKSYEGIQTRIKSLNDVMGLQRAKVEALTKEYDDLKSTGTASESALKKLQEQISKANAELGKTTGELNDATKRQDEFGDETKDTTGELDKYGKETDNAGKKTGKFTEFLKKAGATMKSGIVASAKAVGVTMAAMGAAAAAAVVGVVKLAKSTGDWADELLTTSAQTGIAVQDLQKFEYASRFVDVEVETLTNSMAKNIKSMKAVQDGTKLAVGAYEKLGVEVLNTDGSMRDGQEVYWEVIDALGKMENETERDALAMQILGKSAQDLNPLIKAGADEMKRLGEEAAAAGLVMSDEMVGQLGKFDDLMEKTEAQMEGLGRQVAVTFLPAIQGVGTQVSQLLSEVSTALADGFQPEDVKTIGASLSKMILDGLKQIVTVLPETIGVLSSFLTEAINIIVGILPTLLPIIMDGALQLMQGLLDAISANQQPLMDTVIALLMAFTDFILQNLPMIIELGLQMILALMLGLANALPELVPQIVSTVLAIVDILIENLPLIIDAGLQILLALIDGIIDSLPMLIDKMPELIDSLVTGISDNLSMLIDSAIDIIMAIVDAIIDNLPMLIDAAIEILSSLATALLDNVSKLVSAVPDLVAELVKKFKETDWGKLGKDIIDGIASGIGNAASSLATAAKNAASDALGSVKDFLGINSPSTVFRDQVGVNMGLGVAEGLESTANAVSGAMKTVTKDLTSEVNVKGKVKMDGESATLASGQAILQITNFYNNTDSDLEELAYKLEFMRKKASAAMG